MALSFGVLRGRNFRLLVLTRLFISMALQAQAIIVGWQIYSLTHNPFMLGLTGLAEAAPALTCALFAGHVVDISNPRKVYLGCMTALTVNTTMLFLVGGGLLPVPHHALLTCIYGGVFISGIARSFFMPANFALLPRVVTRAEIPQASAWLSTGFQIATIAGPAVAGLIYGGYGARIAWLLPMLFMASSLMMVIFLNPQYHAEPTKREPAMKSIAAGWRFLLGNPVMLSMMALDMFAVLFGGAVAMLPAYADQVLHIGSQGLGLLRAAPAAGAMVTALYLGVRPMKRISTVKLLWVVTGFGFSMIAFGLSTVFGLSVLFLILSGAFDSVSMVIRGTLMQLLTPDDMRGRVSSVNSMFIISSNELGAFESGTLARLIGLVPSVVAGGVLTLLIVAGTASLSKQLRNTVVDA